MSCRSPDTMRVSTLPYPSVHVMAEARMSAKFAAAVHQPVC